MDDKIQTQVQIQIQEKFNEEEVKLLKEIIKDRQAFSRAFTWILWGLGSVVAFITSWTYIVSWLKSALK